MTITREQVADLQPGDVVEVRIADYDEYVIRGPVVAHRCCGLKLGPDVLRTEGGEAAGWAHRDAYTLTVVSRAPRPLYVNHRRTEPVAGDIVRDRDGDAWRFERDEWWCASAESCDDDDPDGYPIDCYRPLTLLWDGETGQVVP